jgi:hypothetical protein
MIMDAFDPALKRLKRVFDRLKRVFDRLKRVLKRLKRVFGVAESEYEALRRFLAMNIPR